MSKTQAQMQSEFMLAGGQKRFSLNEILRSKTVPQQAYMYMNLIEEEVTHELNKAFNNYANAVYPDEKLRALSDLLDAICDSKVVLSGLANTLGLPEDMAYEEVHKSNMTKFVMGPNGELKVLKRVDGKVIKPKDWNPPNLLDILKYKLMIGE
jgi:predicted HAD superfamily Cof-like phosphohydrolase